MRATQPNRARIHELSTASRVTLSAGGASTRLARKSRGGSATVPDAVDDQVPDIKTPAEAATAPAAPEEPSGETTAGDVEQDATVVEAQADEPQPVATVLDPADAVLVEAVTGGLTWIPFAVYLALWVVLVGLSAYLLYGASADQPARWMPEYVPLLWSGVALTALGPILSMAVWLVARARRPKSERRGLFASAMTRGALVAFFGVAIWVATLFVLELVAGGGAL